MVASLSFDGQPPERIDTGRLLLRRHHRTDARAIAELLGNWNVVRWLAQVPFPYGERDAAEWIGRTARCWAEGTEYQFVVTLRGSGLLIGHAGLRMSEDARQAELGYWFGEAFWGRGYGGETARALVDFGFVALGLDRIWATALPDNGRSLAVLAKAGMVPVGTMKQHFGPIRAAIEVPVLAVARAADDPAR